MMGADELSFWHASIPGSVETRAALETDLDVDVAIIGAGYTGLWTAHYLKRLQPDLRIAILEAETAGFGASGRNGGWCLGGIAGIGAWFDDPSRRERAIRLQRAIFGAVDEVGEVSKSEGIDCHYAKGGMITLASCEAQVGHVKDELAHLRALGFGDEDYRWLDPEDSVRLIRTASNRGSMYSPHCAAIHPLRLARGLAESNSRSGVEIFERTPVISIGARHVRTPGGRVRADMIVCATEGYTRSLPGRRRNLLPLHSMMIATEPLPREVWDEIGLAKRETFGDTRRIVIYGQRTADDRMAFGGRGAYFFGSKVKATFVPDDQAFRSVRESLDSLLPILRDFRTTHRWGGALGISRDWQPSVGVDRSSGLAWAGGYVGEGVAASNLAGRTLADLILERDTDRVDLAWVGDPGRRWEPEPLRWLGVSVVRRLGEAIDADEFAGRPVRRWQSAIYERFAGK